MRQSLLQLQSKIPQYQYPKLRALLEPQEKAVSQPQDLDVPLQMPNSGQGSGVSADGEQNSDSTNPDVIQGEVSIQT